ncbi:MAG: glycosyltransferase family 9 protein [Desulfurobacteriaceae bacterium]
MKILIVRLSSLGDVILTSSVLSPLRKEGIEIDFLTLKPFGEIFRFDKRLRKVFEVEKETFKSLSSIRNLAKSLEKEKYDYVFDLHGVLKTFIFGKFLPFPVYRYKKKTLLRRLMVVFKPFKAKPLFVPELYAEVFKKIGIEIGNPRPSLFLTQEEKERVKKFLPFEEFVAIAPGARWKTKQYPIEKFKKIVELLASKGKKVVVIGGKEERELGDFLASGNSVINFCGKLSIRESLSVISLSQGVISNDSAVVHMARAVKKFVVAIFGPTHPSFGFAPAEDEGITITRNLPCSPCSLHGKTKCENRECFEIPPEEIIEVFLDRISQENF